MPEFSNFSALYCSTWSSGCRQQGHTPGLCLIVCASQSPTCAGAALKATSGALALRGAMALMLRSIASPKQELNLCGLWLNDDYRFSPCPFTSYRTCQISLLEKDLNQSFNSVFH